MTNSTVIELRDVVKTYKRGVENVCAVQCVNFDIEKNDFLAIVGPSGSGKTTLLEIIGCLNRPTSGIVKILNQDITKENDAALTSIRRHTIGFVFQQFFLIPTLTVLENSQIPGLFSHNPDRVEKAKELLILIGLEKRLDHFPSQLSGGEMQRVAIARALVNSPSILLADEPTGNLDTKNALAIFDIFEKLNQNGLTIVMVTHNLGLAKRCKRIIGLEDGKIKY